jgi:hypothetical protein
MSPLNTLPGRPLPDKDCFESLYRAYAAKSYGLILKFTSDEPAAFLILEEVFRELCGENSLCVNEARELCMLRLTLRKIRENAGPGLTADTFRERVGQLLSER